MSNVSTSPDITMDPFLALFGSAGDPSSGGDSTAEAGSQRSRSGCFTCRRRKVKCDESRPVCEKCQIGQREVRGLRLPYMFLCLVADRRKVHMAAR